MNTKSKIMASLLLMLAAMTTEVAAQHQIALRGDRETDAAALKLLQECAGTTILL